MSYDVSSGQIINGISLTNEGMGVYDGGTANNIIINEYGYILLSNGVVNNATINFGGSILGRSGGRVNNTIVNDMGTLEVSNGCLANYTTVNQGGFLDVYQGGVASSTTVSGGSVYVVGSANGVLMEGGVFTVGSGALANNIMVNSGTLKISGTAKGITENGGYISVEDNANATFVPHTISGQFFTGDYIFYHIMTVHSNTVVISNTLKYTSAFVFEGGIASETLVSSADLIISSGGIANNTTLIDDGALHVSSGGTANNNIINADGSLYIRGVANTNTVHSGGYMVVFSGGTANHNTLYGSDAYLDVERGGEINNTTISSGGTLVLLSGGRANNTTVTSGGSAYVGDYYWIEGKILSLGGGTANTFQAKSGGYLHIFSGANVTNLTVETGAYLRLVVAPNTLVQGVEGESAFEINNAHLDDYSVNNGFVEVKSGGTVNNTIILSSGSLCVFSGGFANSATVNSGFLDIANGGTASDCTVSAGYLDVESNAHLEGLTAVYCGGHIKFDDKNPFVKGSIDLRIDDKSEPNEKPFLINSDSFSSFKSVTLTITADENAQSGSYFLANDCENFTSDISITVTGARNKTTTDVFKYDIVKKNYGSVNIGGNTYTLSFEEKDDEYDSGLYLTIADPISDEAFEYISRKLAYSDRPNPDENGIYEFEVEENGKPKKYYFKVKEIWEDPETGFDAILMERVNEKQRSMKQAVLACGGTETKDIKDILSDIDQNGIGYNQFYGRNDVYMACKKLMDEECTLSVTGHSLGGALAQWFAAFSAKYGGITEVDNVVTFNSPGIAGTARVIDSESTANIKRIRHYLNDGDLVSMAGEYYLSNSQDAFYTLFANKTTCDDALEYVTAQHNKTSLLLRSWTNAKGQLISRDPDLTIVSTGKPTNLSSGRFSYLTVHSDKNSSLYAVLQSVPDPKGGYWVFNSQYATLILTMAGNNIAWANELVNRAGSEAFRKQVVNPLEHPILFYRQVGKRLWDSIDIFDGYLVLGSENAVISVNSDISSSDAVIRSLRIVDETELYAFFDFTQQRFLKVDSFAKSSTFLQSDVMLEEESYSISIYLTDTQNSQICFSIPDYFYSPRFQLSGVYSVKEQKTLSLSNLFQADGSLWYYVERTIPENNDNNENASKADPDYNFTFTVNESITKEKALLDVSQRVIKTDTEEIEIFVSDIDASVEGNGAAGSKTISVQVVTASNQSGITVTLQETDLAGLFSGTIALSSLNLTEQDENLTIVYQDADNGAGVAETIEKVVDFNNFEWPEMEDDKNPPTVTNVKASTTELTKESVTVTAEFSDDTEVLFALCRVGETGDWRTYYDDGVTVSENATVYFKAIDYFGNESEIVSYTVSNISNTPPKTPTVTADITATTDQCVTVTASFDERSVLNEYLLNDGAWDAWTPYTDPIVFTENGTVYFRSTDAAGNVSMWAWFTVDNILTPDTTAPTVTDIIVSTDEPTAGSVVLTATYGDDVELASALYRIGDAGEWKNYIGGVIVAKNATVYFKAVDTSGNESGIVSYTVANIDKDAPEKPSVSADITEITDQEVTVSAEFSEDSEIWEYSLDGRTWKEYTRDLVFSRNGVVYFRGTDAAGNVSEVTEYAVTNISSSLDIVPPTVTDVKASFTGLTNQGVTVTAVFDDDVELASSLYRIGEHAAWQPYLNSVKVLENTTVYFKAVDTAGNESEIASCRVSNIIDNSYSIISGLVISNESRTVSSFELYYRTLLSSKGVLYVSSGGIANITTVDPQGYLYVLSGGSATDIFWTPCEGRVIVSDGGYATFVSNYSGVYFGSANQMLSNAMTMDSATVGAYCEMVVMSGGTVKNTMADYGDLFVSSGGTATETTLTNFGFCYISSDGTANGIIVNPGCRLFVYAGGTADAIVENGGYVYVEDNTSVSFAANTISGFIVSDNATIHSGTTATSTTLVISGNLHVSSGGTANKTTISGGNLYVSSGGTATDILWTPCEGHVYVLDGAYTTFASSYSGVYYGSAQRMISNAMTMDSVEVDAYSEMDVMSGGIAKNTTVDYGDLYVSSGGTASNTRLVNSGYLYLSSGGVADNTAVNAGCRLYVMNQGVAGSTTVNSGGNMLINSGGKAGNTLVNQGNLNVFSGGVASSTEVINWGYLNVSSGGTACDITIQANGRLVIDSGGTATGIVWTPCEGRVIIADGGFASFVSSYSGVYYGSDNQLISNAMTMDSVEVDGYSEMVVMSGGTAKNTTVDYGDLFVSSGGIADRTTLINSAYLYLSSGGNANYTEVNAGCRLYVNSKSVASGTTVNSGIMILSSGGVAKDTSVSAGYLLTYGKLTGSMMLAESAVVFAYEGAVIDFDLSALTPSDTNSFLVNDLSRVSGRPVYTLTISDSQAKGSYKLAAGASNFRKDISVVNALGAELGILGIGASITINDAVFTLNLSDDALTLDVANKEIVDIIVPTVSSIKASTVLPTNQDVTVTAVFEDDGVLKSKLYKLGETGEWKTYADGVTVSGNTTVFFKAVDAAGNESEVASYTVGNIDKTAPEAPTVNVDTTKITNKDVLVTPVFSDDSVIGEYSFDGQSWAICCDNVCLTANGTVFFRGIDEAGNISEITSCSVNNIDKLAPTSPTGLQFAISDDIVELSWDASTDNLSGIKMYILKYSNGIQDISFSTTDTNYSLVGLVPDTWRWSVEAVDNAGNFSRATYGVSFSTAAVVPEPGRTFVVKGDIDGNGVSDVMFVWTGNNYQHGYWMNGTSTWQSAGSSHPAEWENLGCYDMTGDGKADSVLVGNVEVGGVKGAYIGYYADANDLPDGSTWVNIGYLNNADDIAWKNKVGNLTGGTANSIVWYAPELYALGAWTDGTESWVTLTNDFGGDDWTLVGCGDFDGDGKDSVVMSGAGGAYFYAVGIEGTPVSLGSANWSGWEVRAIGDFKGDGKDDLVLFHKETGSMVMCADGSVDDFVSIGQLDAKDWFVVGAGDYNGDAKDDLLVRQYSTGMLGYYTSGDTTQWTELGRGVDMNWTVIA